MDDDVNPIDKKIRKYSNNNYLHPSRTTMLRDSAKMIVAAIQDQLNYLDDPDENFEATRKIRTATIFSSHKPKSTELSELNKRSKDCDDAQQGSSKSYVQMQLRGQSKHNKDFSINEVSSTSNVKCKEGMSNAKKYALRIRGIESNELNPSSVDEEKLESSDSIEDLTCSVESWKADPFEMSSDSSSPEDSEDESVVIPSDTEENNLKNKGKSIVGKKISC